MQNQKRKVTSAQIIVAGTKENHYYEIEYREVGKEDYCIGYSSYCLDNVFYWLNECFELVEEPEPYIPDTPQNEPGQSGASWQNAMLSKFLNRRGKSND